MQPLDTEILLKPLDPKYEEEVSGCTATVGIITHDKIYVVSLPHTSRIFHQDSLA